MLKWNFRNLKDNLKLSTPLDLEWLLSPVFVGSQAAQCSSKVLCPNLLCPLFDLCVPMIEDLNWEVQRNLDPS